jgi:hypothetical protein
MLLETIGEDVLSTDHEKVPAINSIHRHVQDFEMSEDLLLAILKAFVS